MGLEINRNQQRRPFGGHHLPEMGMVVRGDTVDELANKIRTLRINNGHPIGNPMKDILRYYAEHFPYMVKSGNDDKDPIQPANYLKWRDWIRYMWFDPPKKLVTATEAKLRWDKCKDCPKSVKKDWPKNEEAEEFERRSFMLRAGQNIPDFLGFCTCHRWDNSLSVFLHEPEKVSNKASTEIQPGECWVKQEVK